MSNAPGSPVSSAPPGGGITTTTAPNAPSEAQRTGSSCCSGLLVPVAIVEVSVGCYIHGRSQAQRGEPCVPPGDIMDDVHGDAERRDWRRGYDSVGLEARLAKDY